jgi:hypothetical protein
MVMLQIIRRLIRIGQMLAVMFYLLKTKNPDHDFGEYQVIEKWMWHLSTESQFADIGLKTALLEICLCEQIKSLWHQSFNRYA